MICALPTLFLGSAFTAANDVPPSAKNRARYATKWPRTCVPTFFIVPPPFGQPTDTHKTKVHRRSSQSTRTSEFFYRSTRRFSIPERPGRAPTNRRLRWVGESAHPPSRPERAARASARLPRLRARSAARYGLEGDRQEDLGAVRRDRRLHCQVRSRHPQVQVPARPIHLVRRLPLVRRALVRRRARRGDLRPRDGPLARSEAAGPAGNRAA